MVPIHRLRDSPVQSSHQKWELNARSFGLTRNITSVECWDLVSWDLVSFTLTSVTYPSAALLQFFLGVSLQLHVHVHLHVHVCTLNCFVQYMYIHVHVYRNVSVYNVSVYNGSTGSHK